VRNGTVSRPYKFCPIFHRWIWFGFWVIFWKKSLINWICIWVSTNLKHRVDITIRPIIQSYRQNLIENRQKHEMTDYRSYEYWKTDEFEGAFTYVHYNEKKCKQKFVTVQITFEMSGPSALWTSPHFKQRNTPILADLKCTKNKYLLQLMYNEIKKNQNKVLSIFRIWVL